MLRYIAYRIGHAVIVLWATFTAVFFLLYVLPGDIALSKLNVSGSGNVLTPEAIAEVRAKYGLDQPVLIQYVKALWNALHGDFGISGQTGGSALLMFAKGIPETLKLAATAFLIALVAGVSWSLLIAYIPWRQARAFLTSLPVFGVAAPNFWVGLVLLQLFSFHWPIFPAMGNQGFASIVLPSIVLSIPTGAMVAQILSQNLEATYAKSFIETVRARGASRGRILFVHALRNSIIPVITALGVSAGYLIAGSVVVETVFSRSGIGLTTVTAVTYQDTPVVLVAVLFAATVFVLVNLVVDLLYPLIDPRIDIGARAGDRAGNLAR